jgi:BASS family bile acid:Na+ symporter
MSLTAIIILTLKISIGLSVFSLGMKEALSEATFLFRRPEKLLNALVSMYVAMPLFAVTVALAFDLPPAVKIALVALSVSPIPPILPRKALGAGGRESYAIGLLVAGSLLSVILIPLAMELFQVVFNVPLQMTPRAVAGAVLASVLLPLAAGMAVRALLPAFAERIVGPTSIVATVLLYGTALPILISQGGQFLSLMQGGTFVALVAFAAVGLLIGHVLGGPQFEERTVLALYTSARHPGVAVAIAQANFPQQRIAIAAILLALLTAAVVSIPYLNWIKHHKPGAPTHTGRGARI